jgi:hypothetical protein
MAFWRNGAKVGLVGWFGSVGGDAVQLLRNFLQVFLRFDSFP